MQQRPELDISDHRGPGQPALDTLKTTALQAAGLMLLGALFSLSQPKSGPSEDAKIKAAQAQMRSFQDALLNYRLDNGRPPTSFQGLGALIEAPTSQPRPSRWRRYMEIPEIPKDPWGTSYEYASPGPYGEHWVIRSLGKDGATGGIGHAADLTVDNLDAASDETSGR